MQQFLGSYLLPDGKFTTRTDHRHQLVFQKSGIFDIRQTKHAFNKSQVNAMFLQSSLYLSGIAVQQRQINMRKLTDKTGEQRRQYILGNSSTGPQLQTASVLIM